MHGGLSSTSSRSKAPRVQRPGTEARVRVHPLHLDLADPRGRNMGYLAVCEMIGHDVFQIRVDADGGAA